MGWWSCCRRRGSGSLSEDQATRSAVKLKYIHTPSFGQRDGVDVVDRGLAAVAAGEHGPGVKGAPLMMPIELMATLDGRKPNSTPWTSCCGSRRS
jgi:hypothetical protein